VGPCPGFALYQTVTENLGADYRLYNLIPERGWEADLTHLESLIDEHTKVIVVTNPSNPCGSVYSKEHLSAILDIAERHKVLVLADEIYCHQVFPAFEFFPLASLTTTVPILSVGGIAKEFLVPGWRVGWVIVYDKHGALEEIRKGLFGLSQVTLGCCSLIMSAVPAILTPAAGSEEERQLAEFHTSTIATLQRHAEFTVDRVSRIPGLNVVVPKGAMYMMFGIDTASYPSIEDDVDFCKKLLAEESVFLLPGQCFALKNFCRIVYSSPLDKLDEAYTRMEAFCARYYVKPSV